MAKPKVRCILNLDLPIPNPPYSLQTSKYAYALYLVYHSQIGTTKTHEELLYEFKEEYQGTYSKLQDFVFNYMSADPEKREFVFPEIKEIEQGPYSTKNPWNLFTQFAKEWFHKTECHDGLISCSSSLFLSLSPANGNFAEFHVFAKRQPIIE
jgi:hypothetical protein